MSNLLIRNGMLLEKDGRLLPLDILIEEGRISDKKPRGGFSGWTGQTFHAEGKIVMPGLVNAHTHSNERFLRGTIRRLPLELWALYVYPGAGFYKAAPDEAYSQALLCGMEMLKNGVTSVVDNIFYPGMDPDTHYQAAKAYEDLGIRADVSVGCADIPFTETFPLETWNKNEIASGLLKNINMPSADRILMFLKELREGWDFSDTIQLSIGPSRPQRCTPELWDRLMDFAMDRDLMVTIHCMETRYQAQNLPKAYNGSLIGFLKEKGHLGPWMNLIHCVWLRREEMEAIQTADANMTLCPVSNQKLGSGTAPVKDMRKLKCNIAFGTDGAASNDSLNVLETLKAAELLGFPGSSGLSVLNEAVNNGKKILGDRRPWLETGSFGDIITLPMDQYALLPANKPAEQIIFSQPLIVKDAVVAGRLVMKDGVLLQIDEKNMLDKCVNKCEELYIQSRPSRDMADILLPDAEETYRKNE